MRLISYIIIGVIILIFVSPFNFYDTGNEPVNYLFRSFYHANITHLAANTISLYNLSFIEEIIGQKQFFFAMLFIWIVSSILLYVIHKFIPSRKVYTVGFSAVIFGLIVVYYSLLNRSPGVTFAGLVISILPQIVIPGISFEGHLSGIIAGIIYVMLFGVKATNNQINQINQIN